MILRRLSDQFADEALACEDLAALGRLLAQACRELGFSYYALLHHASLAGLEGRFVLLENYPQPWRETFVANRYAVHDPVHFASRRSAAPFRWNEIGRLVRLDRRQELVLRQSRLFGIGDGFTVPANAFGEPAGSCSFALAAGAELPEQRLPCAALIGAAAFAAARRIAGIADQPLRTHVSRREAECLRLLILGKTDWEAAAILGISEHTVRQYVKSVKARYDVVSRAQLALLGLADGWAEAMIRPPKRRR